MLILWRMYKAFGNQSGNSDVPGKLASPAGTTPLASFNDIQGIDDAKMEVMELVDTLRFPDKYAVLGARAPTGLLLEGPPGTGENIYFNFFFLGLLKSFFLYSFICILFAFFLKTLDRKNHVG